MEWWVALLLYLSVATLTAIVCVGLAYVMYEGYVSFLNWETIQGGFMYGFIPGINLYIIVFGSLKIMKYLVYRLHDAWERRKDACTET